MYQLQQRAVYDLGCPAEQLGLSHVDARTKMVSGCGRRLVYVEDCAQMSGTILCSWRVDTPSFAQQSWPAQYQAQLWWLEQTRAGAPIATSPGAAPKDDRGRSFRTDLFEDGRDRTAPQGPQGRPIATELFEPPAATPPPGDHLLDSRH